MAGSPEDICLLTCSPQSPGTHGGPGAAPSREGELESRGHVAGPELGAGARAAGTRGGPGAAPSWEREPELWGHVAASELPSAGRREPLS
jgi:hypothetical protein